MLPKYKLDKHFQNLETVWSSEMQHTAQLELQTRSQGTRSSTGSS